MKRISRLVSILVLICLLSGCGSRAPAPAPTEAPAPEAPSVEAVPAEAVALPPLTWYPTPEQEAELLDFAVSAFSGQSFFSRAEINGDQLHIFVSGDPDDALQSSVPLLKSIFEKFFEMRDDENLILYVTFSNEETGKSAFVNSFDLK